MVTWTFGIETISVPCARVEDEAGKISEWRSKALPRYQRLTRTAEALIASVYLSGTNTRRVKRALHALFADPAQATPQMTSLYTCLRSSPQRQAGGSNGVVTTNLLLTALIVSELSSMTVLVLVVAKDMSC